MHGNSGLTYAGHHNNDESNNEKKQSDLVEELAAQNIDNPAEYTISVTNKTLYEQLNFIKENISQINKRRLLVTDPEIQRDEVIAEHANSPKPTVLISP